MKPGELPGKVLRTLVRALGYELIPTRDVPIRTFAGLKRVQFGTILDIGANDGAFAYYARRHLKFREIHCFEPLESVFGELVRRTNRWSTPAQPYFCHNLALGASSGQATIIAHSSHTVSSSLLESTARNLELYPEAASQERQTVRVERLDQYFLEKNLQLLAPCLVKMDVQGFEDQVIAGGQSVISQSQMAMIEVNLESMYEGQARFTELVLTMQRLGFDYRGNVDQLCSPRGRIISCDCLFAKPEFLAAQPAD